MSVKSVRIDLDKEVYFPGETISGRLVLNVAGGSILRSKGITVSIRGVSAVRWAVRQTC